MYWLTRHAIVPGLDTAGGSARDSGSGSTLGSRSSQGVGRSATSGRGGQGCTIGIRGDSTKANRPLRCSPVGICIFSQKSACQRQRGSRPCPRRARPTVTNAIAIPRTTIAITVKGNGAPTWRYGYSHRPDRIVMTRAVEPTFGDYDAFTIHFDPAIYRRPKHDELHLRSNINDGNIRPGGIQHGSRRHAGSGSTLQYTFTRLRYGQEPRSIRFIYILAVTYGSTLCSQHPSSPSAKSNFCTL